MSARPRACVVVLGDAGRSPRMMCARALCSAMNMPVFLSLSSPPARYHCCSLLDNGFLVDLIGSDGAQLPSHLRTNAGFQMHSMTPVMQRHWHRVFFIIFAAIKLLLQSLQLLYRLFAVPRPSFYLVLSRSIPFTIPP